MEKAHVLVCVTGQKSCERLIIVGAQYAARLEVDLMVLHVARNGADVLGLGEAEALEFLFAKASEYGGDMKVVRADNVLDALEKQAHQLNAVQIVAGRAADYSGWDLLDELRQRLPEIPFRIMTTNERPD